jgi:hypothetical protein
MIFLKQQENLFLNLLKKIFKLHKKVIICMLN